MKAKKSLGQNFLIDENVINNIVKEIGILPDSLVVEIGPGQGALTKLLVKEAKNVVAYEIDKDCIDILEREIKTSNLDLINKDILKANIKEDLSKYNYKHLYIVGNLPYYITTPIMLKLIHDNLPVDKYVFMVQEEVADRYTSLNNNKEYNALTVYLNYLFETKKCFVVKNTSFNPIPKVSSSVISLAKKEINKKPLNEAYFYEINKLIFRQKRKTLANNLKDSFSKDIIDEVYTRLNYKSGIRAEELSIDDIIKLSDTLFILSNVYEEAHSKINLTLRVFDEEKGYHNINSLMVNLKLHDILVFVKSKEDKVISNIDIENNIILKTIKLFKETFNIKEGVTVYLVKNIPLSAGLAGGSSDSSATLRGLNKLFNLNKSLDELASLANKLGSDNNFCLHQKTAICRHFGEVLDIKDLNINKKVLLLKPSFGLSTKDIYTNYQFEERPDLTDQCFKALEEGKDFTPFLFNDLEKPALLNKEYKDFVLKLNKLKVKTYQSGSGPTRFCFDAREKERLEKELKDVLIIETTLM